MSKKKQLKKELSTIEEAISEKYEALDKEHKEALEKLTAFETGEEIEKYLKNEAYAFLLSEGLVERFLDFREPFHRNKAQNAAYTITMEAGLEGLWIDIL